jgi:anti-sigma regulatory factor (Ser/Thr protein kinase)
VSSEIASENRFQLRVPATAEHLPIVRQAMRAFLEADGVTDERIEDVLLAVTEACANVVQHAYRDDDGTGDVDLIAAIGDGAVTVTVVDSGLGFAPRVDSPGLGLGLPVMAALATRLEISTRDEGGTVVEMAFEPKTL